MNRKLWAALAVVIVAGLVGWWWHQRSGTPAAPHDSAGSAAPPPRAPEPPRPRGEVDPQPRVVVDDDPTGALRLEGQVIDTDDQPVAGAKVTISSRPARTAVTEADGGFAFDALVGRTYTLVARAPHGVAGPVTARLTEKSPPVIMK
ncbi:MAG: carboxypeptidase regulatory-like domain-containing protein, partial [Kofleriaceae bacterium]